MKPIFYKIEERIVGFAEWCEKNKRETIKRFNPEEYKRLYEKSI